jgi:hypothetical protein
MKCNSLQKSSQSFPRFLSWKGVVWGSYPGVIEELDPCPTKMLTCGNQ